MFSLIGGLFSLSGGVLLLYKKIDPKKLVELATPFAAGALLSAVFLDLLPEGIHESSADSVLLATLIGVLIFFAFERSSHWFHHHHNSADSTRKNIPLIIVGDTLHNALDGVAIAAAFLINVPTGVVTTIAIAAHEIPQEIGDFALLLSRGVSRLRVVLVNVLSALATLLFAVVTFALGSSDKLPVGVLLGLSAGFLLYIAASDLIPSIHEHSRPKKKLLDKALVLLVLGALLVGVSTKVAHKYIDTEHSAGNQDSSLHTD